MKYSDLFDQAVLWTCYIENYPQPERYMDMYELTRQDVVHFDHLGRFFPFDEHYVRSSRHKVDRSIEDLSYSDKEFILPWVYWPRSSGDTLFGKKMICPSAELFASLDNKLTAKKLFSSLNIPTPQWCLNSKGRRMVEKPTHNSAAGLNIRLTSQDASPGYFLEEYIPDHRSMGLQFFIHDECEFICADEMLYAVDDGPDFTFRVQKNVQREELPDVLLQDSFAFCEHLRKLGYRGFCGLDSLVGDATYYMIEVNPRGIAFLPVYYAGVASGWDRFISYMREGDVEEGEVVLLDFGRRKKVIKEVV